MTHFYASNNQIYVSVAAVIECVQVKLYHVRNPRREW